MKPNRLYIDTRLFAITILLLIALIHESYGQSNSGISKSMTIDPDAYNMVLGKNGSKWDNKIGGAYFQSFYEKPKFNFSASLGGFINIHDFNKDQLFSWQLWRGNLGLTTVFQFKNLSWLDKSKGLIAELSYKHESQHATDVFGYVHRYMFIIPQNFDNARAFEYVQFKSKCVRILIENKLTLDLTIGYKHFFKPMLLGAPRILHRSLLIEAGLEWKMKKRYFIYTKIYIESIKNSFIAFDEDYRGGWNKEPFKYQIIESGFYHLNKDEKIIGLFFNYSNSNGRGYDFIEINQQYGLGLRVNIN